MASRPEGTPAAAPAPAPSVTEGAPSFEDAFAAAAASESGDITHEPIAPAAPAGTEVPADPPAPAVGTEPPAESTPSAGAPPAEGAPPAAPAGTPPVGEPAGTPPPAGTAPESAPPAAPTTPTAEEIVAKLTEKLGQPAEAPPAQAPEQAPLYSAEEQAIVADYEKNWPDVAQAEAIKRRGEYHDLLKYTFTEVHKFLQPHLSQIAAMGNTLHTQELGSLVSDYTPALEADVAKWIDTQPAYLQEPYKQVMQQGTSEEVADLIGRYRAASGTAPAPAPAPAPAGTAPAPAAPAAPAKTELSNLAKQAAESLAPVSSDRTQVPVGEDPQDFQSAFARYASEAAATP